MKKHAAIVLFSALLGVVNIPNGWSAALNDYCNLPPFVSQSVPPLVLLETDRDQRLYYQAYNDGSDLDGDGRLEVSYDHSIDYYGYFDPYKCYTYDSTNGRFNPASNASNKFCSSSGGQWSGNILNWLTMSRMDVLRKVLYGGHRSTDTATSGATSGATILERVYIPHDTHSWAKEFSGRLCMTTTPDDTHPQYRGMCIVNSDCDGSIGYSNCVDVSKQLIGYNSADQPTACSSSVTVNNATDKMLWVRYLHDSTMSSDAQCGIDSLNLNQSYDPQQLQAFGAATSFNDGNLVPSNTGPDHSNLMVVAEFNVISGQTGDWQFILDSDDGAELLIAPSAASPTFQNVASTYGCHGACFLPTSNDPTNSPLCTGANNTPNVVAGTYTANSTGWYRLVVHHTNNTGQSGVRVWVKRPHDGSWSIFGSTILGSSNLRSPAITVSPANSCSVMTQNFINTGTPTTGSVTGKRHLFCNTTDSVSGNGSSNTGVTDFVPGAPLLKMVLNSAHRKWEWNAKESLECDWAGEPDGWTTVDNSKTFQYNTRVKVCDSTVGLETNCRKYTDSGTGAVTYKPGGLLQKYGEGIAGDKVCSKTFYKTCSTDADCTPATDGLCVQRAPMYFGLMTDSYTKNLSGGVLRKDISAITDEYSLNNGVFNFNTTGNAGSGSDLPQGNLIRSFERFRIVGYDYSSNNYSGTPPFGGACNSGNSWLAPLTEGSCRDWGNPIAEVMYEGLRYFAGKGTPTSVFDTADSWVSPKQSWGIPQVLNGTAQSTLYQPYQIYPKCAKSFALVLSDINPSYDGDQIPGSRFAAFTEDGNSPQLKINVGILTDTIGTNENINNGNWFVGQTTTSPSSNNDGTCTSKPASGNLSNIRGLCPEEPSKYGSYYSAAVAFYGKSFMPWQLDANSNFSTDATGNKIPSGLNGVTTYSVPVASPIPKIGVTVGGSKIEIVPIAKSIDGTWSSNGTTVNGACWSQCKANSTFDVDGTGGRVLNLSCSANAYCATHTIQTIHVEDIRYDSNNNTIYGKYMVVFGDSEEGSDWDMDTRAEYEVCTAAAVTAGYGSCGTQLLSNQIELKVTNPYASAGIQAGIGFTVSGTSGTRTALGKSVPNDGAYIVNRQMDKTQNTQSSCPTGSSQPCTVNTLGTSWSKVFTASGSAAGLLKDPLWYAAKWGGFNDMNGNGIPDQQAEWDKDGNGDPDNYYLVLNPLKLENQLNQALNDILTRVSSGTAASILNNSQGSGANLIQAVFYPKKNFDNNSYATWVGEMQDLWYYFDPFFTKSTIREDTDGNNILDLKNDYIVQFYFDSTDNQTKVQWYQDVNGDSSALTPKGTGYPDSVNSLWKAGSLLWSTTPSSRKIYSVIPVNGTDSLINFSTANSTNSTLQGYLQTTGATANTDTYNLIDYISGTDYSSFRNRTVTIGSTSNVWKLGDIISSTPKIESTIPLQLYNSPSPTGYNDGTYTSFLNSYDYGTRGMAYVGSNDGMLHAFNLGILDTRIGSLGGSKQARLLGSNLGKENWSFIPKNVLPYLKYLSDVNYNHIYYVDGATTVIDASINSNGDAGCSGGYWTCARKTTYLADANGKTLLYDTIIPADPADPPNLSKGYLKMPKIDNSKTSWRTVLVGSMGLGGASRASDNTTCSDCVKNPVKIGGTTEAGYSSYFALDVTTPTTPAFMWEFNDPTLGYATTGPAIIRIAPSDPSGHTLQNTNGKWFAVFASGPTGPIDTTTHQFMAHSDQTLKIFIVDLATGVLVRKIDTGITNAFAGSLSGASLDTDRWNPTSNGFYSDDVIYIGYVQSDGGSPASWSKGGVIRLVTNDRVQSPAVDNTDPANWNWSTVIDNIGPVTTSVTKLQDTTNHKLWLYFGTGRYYYKTATGLDDANAQRLIYGIKEPCYYTATSPADDIDPSCSAKVTSGLVDQTSNPSATLSNSATGWYINLDCTGTRGSYPLCANNPLSDGFMSERVITDPVANSNGVVYFTTFRPTADICGYGGNSYIWALKYDTGGQPPSAAMKGKAMMQVSTGSFAMVSLDTGFSGANSKGNRRINTPIQGVPPKASGLTILGAPRPTRKILQVQEH